MRKTRQILFKSKPSFAFVVEGACESWYISMLKRNEKSIHVDLKPEIPQKKKLSDQYEKVMELSAIYDKVFWIIDFDVIDSESRTAKGDRKSPLQELKQYVNAIEKEKANNVIVVVNNPCLEYWFLLHYEFTSKYFNTCGDAEKVLRKHLPEYEKTQRYYTQQGNDIYLKLKPCLATAHANVKKLKAFDFKNPHSGSCGMHLFFETNGIKHILDQF